MLGLALLAVSSLLPFALAQSEENALRALYASTSGRGWINQDGWTNSDTCFCTWYGVTCDPGCDTASCDGELCSVLSLNLTTNNLKGSLPETLKNLAKLQVLDLSFNSLSGQLPSDFLEFPDLNYISLYDTGLGGPLPSFAQSPKLNFIALDSCKFTGTLPLSLFRLENLEYLYLSRNSLTGPVWPSDSSTALNNIKVFYVVGNQFSGTLPPQLFQPSMQRLAMSENNFHGTIPREISTSNKLEFLSLDSNPLEGEIPAELCELPALQSLLLSHNNISGTIPDCLGSLPLQRLILSFSKLSGPFPSALGSLSQLASLELANLGLTGTIPQSLGKIPLKQLVLAGNRLSGALPSDISAWRLSLTILDLQRNLFSGQLSQFLNPFLQLGREIRLNRAFSLLHLLLNDNMLSGSVPFLYGLSSLKELNLARNRLDGEISPPRGKGDLSNADYSGNAELHGCLPDEFGAAYPFLVSLDIEGTAMRAGNCHDRLPYWLSFNYNVTVFESAGARYVCPIHVGSTNPQLRVFIDPIYYNFNTCVCANGYYGRATPQCISCPSACKCIDGGVSGCFPQITKDNKTVLSECPTDGTGSTPCNPDQSPDFKCAEGYTGELCSKCATGYSRVGSLCLACQDSYSFLPLAFSALVFLAILIYLFRAQTSKRSTLQTTVTFVQTFAILIRSNTEWDAKVLESFYFAFTTFSLSITNLSCYTENISVASEAMLNLLKPAMMLIAVWGIARLARLSARWKHFWFGYREPDDRPKYAANFLLCFCFFDVAYMGFEALACTLALPDGSSHLNTRPWVECSFTDPSSKYQKILALGVACLVYVVAVLSHVFQLVYRSRPHNDPHSKRLSSQLTFSPFGGVPINRPEPEEPQEQDLEEMLGMKEADDVPAGFLYQPFKRRYWFWGCVLMVRRLALAAALALVPFTSPQTLYIIVFLIILGSLLLHCQHGPFRHQTDNILEAHALAALTVTFFLACISTYGIAFWMQAFVVLMNLAVLVRLVLELLFDSAFISKDALAKFSGCCGCFTLTERFSTVLG
eukprot:TRINITY_DN3517_c0_g1_i1.p1 TRINITY_DN3517_c0_g1~~TRINITY_DN3517_c0_g1_i1.p1  ORF type:complete len:1038 (+),score=192.48 TRINITY_DN3517_c0_g1_i1:3-3116(+)